MTTTDATRLAGEAYRTRLVRGGAAAPDDKTRLAQEGYQSRLARDAANVQPDTNEFYKVGEKIGGHYEVAAIHHGELGVVYGCFDHRTKLPRALKTVRARHARDQQILSLFESEATVWVSLEKHPYIVRAYLVERFNNLPYVITEYVRGPEGMEGDLRGWLGHPRLTLPVAVAMALQIAQGMQHAVRKVPNLVHRDLKPGNILVNGDGKAMVTDFGLVHAAQSGAGTPAYMSPEQWRAVALDARSDIYSYGCILFEMFTAHRLFPALTERDWERAHLESSPAALTSIVPELPVEIDQFVRRCLEKDPAARPQSWDEIVAFFAEWYHRLTGNAVVLDFSSLALDVSEWINASYSLLNLDRYEEMSQACDRALALDQNDWFIWWLKGVALAGCELYEESLMAFDRGLAIDQNRKTMWDSRGDSLSNLHRHQEAIEAYDCALAIDQNYPSAWYGKGTALFFLGRFEEAIQAYDRALTIDQNYVAAWFFKGIALGRLDRHKDAIQAYDRALAINQNYADAWCSKADALHALNRHEEAVQDYDRALALDQGNERVWGNKGNALWNLKRYEEAIQACDQALAIDHNCVDAWFNKGNALYCLKRYDEALQAYDRVLAINQNNAVAWCNKGITLYNLKRYSEAIDAYDRVLILDPNSSSARENRAIAVQLSMPSEGAIVKGIVKNITDYGAFVDVGGIDCLLHITDLAWRRLKHPTEVVNIGDEVTAKVLKIDTEKNRVSLGLKQLGEDPWVGISLRYPQGTRLFGKVTNITDYGPFVEVEAGIDGLVHVSEMDWTKQNVHPSKVVQVGDEVEVMIIEIDEERRRISLGMKQCTPDPRDDFTRELKKGDVLAEGKRYEEAVSAYDQALHLNPDDANVWFKKGNALLRLERYEEALSAFDRASPLDTKGGISFIKGFTLQKLKRYEESICACDRALAINPTLAIAQSTKSFSLQELKRHEAAFSVRQPQSFWARLWSK